MNDFHFRLRRPLPSIPVVSLLSCLLTISAASDAAEVEPVAEDSHPRIVVPFLKATCFDCHAGDNPDSGVSLDTLLGADTNQHRALWEAALKQLKAGAMPPDDVARPDEQEVAAVTRWIDSELYSVDCDAETDSGRVTIRRLNRAEYGNTIRDLLGVPVDTSTESCRRVWTRCRSPPRPPDRALGAVAPEAPAQILVVKSP